MSRTEIPEFFIEQYALNECSTTHFEEIQQLDDAQKKAAFLLKDNQDILSLYPPKIIAARIQSKVKPKRHGFSFLSPNKYRHKTQGFQLRKALALSLGLICILGFSLLSQRFTPNEMNDTVRLKGIKPGIFIYRSLAEGSEQLENLSNVSHYDLIQLSYVAANAKYGAIISIDGNAYVTLHYPMYSQKAAKLETQGEITLPYSYQLDNAPSFETFYFIVSENEFSIDTIIGAAWRAAATGNSDTKLNLRADFEIYTMTLLKDN